jgi:hypothetical protein
MKKVIVALVLMFGLSLSVFSQDYSVKRGYKGFIDFGYSFNVAMDGFADEISGYDSDKLFWSTSHGYQFNPYLFLGGGVGFHLMQKYETPYMDIPLDSRDYMIDIPVYAETRITFINGNISPFISGRGGYYFTHNGGLYLNASVGCRFALSTNHAINVFVGYSSENLEFDTFKRFTSSSSMNYNTEKRKLSTEGFSIKVGYEF